MADPEASARRRRPSRSGPRSPPRSEVVLDAGGLYVIGTERHESRRIDNQLRGRSGRQGDPGRARKFFLSLEDDLMRIFGSERMDAHAAAPRPEGGRGDHPSLDQQGAGEGAAEGRGAQLRDPQEPAEVRRRDERPAQGDLRAAPRADGGEDVAETVADMRHEVDRRPGRAAHPGQRLCRAVGRRAACTRRRCASSASTCRSPTGPRKKASPTRRSASA